MTQIQSSEPAPHGNIKLVIVAIIVAAIAVVLVNLSMALERRGRHEQETTIYFLNRSVRPGDKLKPKDIDGKKIPKRYEDAFGQAIRENEMLENRYGQRFVRAAPQGRVLTFDLFSDSADGAPPLSPRRGHRLVALPVNSRTVPGVLMPGTIVDIEAPFNVGGTVPLVMPVMEHVEVLALGRRSVADVADRKNQRNLRNFRTITIEVEPWEATYLSMIEKLAVGEFELHLRNPTDRQYPKTKSPRINPMVKTHLEKALGRTLPGLQ